MHAVVLCGGRATRLHPLTESQPKALLPLGEMPLLDLLLHQLGACGYRRVTLAVGPKSDQIEAYCGDGSAWGLELDLFHERFPLGTAGALVSLKDRLPEYFLALNGDLLCTPEFPELMAAHRANGSALTLALWERPIPIDYGVLELDAAGEVRGYVEKPTLSFPVSAGIYAISRRALDSIPRPARLDFPELVQRLLNRRERVSTHRWLGEWIDIGTPDELKRAREAWAQRPRRFLPPTASPKADPLSRLIRE